jgi:hypothetical protein
MFSVNRPQCEQSIFTYFGSQFALRRVQLLRVMEAQATKEFGLAGGPCSRRMHPLSMPSRRRMQWARSDIVAHAQSAPAAAAGPSSTASVDSPRRVRKIHGRCYSHCRCHHCTLMCQSSKQSRNEFSCHFRLMMRLWTSPW